MKYEDFVSLLTTGRFTEEEAPEYCEDANEGELLSHTRRFLTEACGIKDLTNQITSDDISLQPSTGGGFADIYRSALNNGNQVAIRTQYRKSSESSHFRYRETIKNAYNWSQMRHRNINELLGFTIFRNAIGLVSYYASNGGIPQYIYKRPSADRMNLCIQISQGVSYMHSIGMLHGDIKGANVVVMEDGTAKLIDLETSVSEQSAWSFETRGHSLRASIRWVAPEIFQDEPVTTRASDVYGLAMTILEIASGKVPWSKISRDIHVIRRVINGETPDRPAQILDVNGDSLWELLLDCWKLEPKERPSAGSVLRVFLARNPDADRCQLSTQICEGVAYLHNIGIAHGDLKGDNVFVSDSGSALLADLGSADVEGRAVDFTLFMNRCGYTTRWAAPELIKYGVFRCREADIYALGMTILQTLTGEVPFKYKRQDHMVIMAVIGKREFPKRPLAQIPVDSEHGDKLWDLLCWCWSPELENRPNADQVVKEMRTITRDGLAPTAQD
ncbi:Tyrosine kinase specific for activated [Rhizoctonia solani]|uniref:Tyrosine kinase specific for activated n=1 Tax=Rhizoctonia solani TaxID=456999 RepID=A0A8H8NZC6_9AGAM|nr:Tyrosine kinase specific for activated [Rhizoctonia solani]QRW21096.1 Tyrosine kinase specific for activated [Rhizoctonia solani]